MSRMWEIWHAFYLQVKHPLSEAPRSVSRQPGSPKPAFLWSKRQSCFFICLSFLLSFLLSLPSFFLSLSFCICLIQYNLKSRKLQGKESHIDWTRKIFCYELSIYPTIINGCIQEKYSFFYTLVEIYYIVIISHRLCSGFQLDVYTPVGC